MRALVLAVLALPVAALGADFSSFREVPRDVLAGARAQAEPEGLLTLLAAGAAAGAARAGDAPIKDSLQRSTPLGRSATDAGALIGNYALLLPAAGAGYLIGGFARASQAQEASLMTFEALSVAGVETETLKFAVRRERPDGSDHYSFPSGHAAGAFSAATVAAAEYGWKAGVPSFLVAGFVGYTRLEKNKHYLSDVLFGAGLGVAAGRAVYKTHRSRHPERFALIPYAAPGGGGVIVLF